jgi:hypothetical protein
MIHRFSNMLQICFKFASKSNLRRYSKALQQAVALAVGAGAEEAAVRKQLHAHGITVYKAGRCRLTLSNPR